MSNGAALPPRRPAKRNTVKQSDAARDPAFTKALQLSTFEVRCRCGAQHKLAVTGCSGVATAPHPAERPIYLRAADSFMSNNPLPRHIALTTRMDIQPRTSLPPSATSLFRRAKRIPTVSLTVARTNALSHSLWVREDNDDLVICVWLDCSPHRVVSLSDSIPAYAGRTVVCFTTKGIWGRFLIDQLSILHRSSRPFHLLLMSCLNLELKWRSAQRRWRVTSGAHTASMARGYANWTVVSRYELNSIL